MNSAIYEKTGVIHCGDNLETLARLPDEHVDLIYLDPPFFSNRRYEIIWNDEAEVRSFDDRWKGGVREYIGWMRQRMVEMHRVLKSTGSLYLHCDPTASHYLKVMLDELFVSPGGFRTEIVWKRSSAHSDTKQGRKQHGHIHDVILFYTKGDDWTWNPVYTPYDEAYLDAEYRHKTPSGRRYKQTDLTAAKPGGDVSYEWPIKRPLGKAEWTSDLGEEWRSPVVGWEYKTVRPYEGRYWAYAKDGLVQFATEGRLHYRSTGMPRLMQCADEMPGVSLQDTWTDIDPISAKAAERLG